MQENRRKLRYHWKRASELEVPFTVSRARANFVSSSSNLPTMVPFLMTKSSFRRPRAVDAAGGAVARSTGDNGNAPGCLFCLSVRCSIVVTVSSSYRACDCDLYVTTPSYESRPVKRGAISQRAPRRAALRPRRVDPPPRLLLRCPSCFCPALVRLFSLQCSSHRMCSVLETFARGDPLYNLA